MFERLKQQFSTLRSRADFHALRIVRQSGEHCQVRRNVAEPPFFSSDLGAMLSVRIGGVEAYAATSDLSIAGLQRALDLAEARARLIAPYNLVDARVAPPQGHADYRSPGLDAPLPGIAERIELLREESAAVPADPRLVNWTLLLSVDRHEQLYLNSAGAEHWQELQFVYPGASVTAFDGHDSQTRSFGGYHGGQQGGAEVIQRLGLRGAAPRVADEALQLLLAPNTPEGPRDLLLMPEQMMLQIHESIGHPLELDRILGDERNYAGTSFIRQEDFGHYQYGSALLNVSFDPGIPEELASYGHDDDGSAARKTLLIEKGLLLHPRRRPLAATQRPAGRGQQPRLQLEPRAHRPHGQPQHRARRPAPGAADRRHRARHPDDHQPLLVHRRCAQQVPVRLRMGPAHRKRRAQGVVKNPNYRGISASFWRSLAAVGDASTFEVLGTPFCGKGEPNQVVRVGHASPACVFSQVDVFGGAA